MKSIVALLCLLFCLASFGAEEAPVLTEAPSLQEEAEVQGEVQTEAQATAVVVAPAVAASAPLSAPAPLLMMRARIDAAFVAGDPSVQGFSLPSVRLAAHGDVAPHFRYRLAAGQAREFSSVLLPQLIPVEALIEAHSVTLEELESAGHFSLRVGLFTPQFNPQWTPDLGELSIPDYQETHRALFISRDTGAEVAYTFADRRAELTLGMFNGSGPVALNTNNAKAFTGSGLVRWEMGSSKGYFGVAGYLFSQSSEGSLNYKSRWVTDGFAGADWEYIGLSVQADLFYGDLEDSTRAVSAQGAALTLSKTLWSGARFFFRAEKTSNTISGATNLRRLQLGPVFSFHPAFQIFTFLSTTTEDAVVPVNTFQVRFRLNI